MYVQEIMKKYLFALAITSVIAYTPTPNVFAQAQIQSSYWQSSSTKTTKKPLKIYAEPNLKSKSSGTVAIGENFSVKAYDWVKVSTSDGKITGWALAKDVQDHINSVASQSYLIRWVGPSDHYKVVKISPAEQKARYENARKNAKNYWRRQQSLFEQAFFTSPFFDEDDNYPQKKSQDPHSLQEQVDILQKKVDQLEKK